MPDPKQFLVEKKITFKTFRNCLAIAIAIAIAIAVAAGSLRAQSVAATPLLGDFNGDGIQDVAIWDEAAKMWDIYLGCNNLNGYLQKTCTGFAPPVHWDGLPGTDGVAYATDLTGSGKADILSWDDASKTWWVNISTGSGFTQEHWPGMWGSDGDIRLVDLNGDGKTDILMWREATKTWSVNLSTGKGFDGQSWTGAWGSDGPINVGDLTGDGKTDVFMWRDSTKSWTINISTGKGFKAQEWKGAWGSDGPIFVGDLTGDKKADVFMWRDSTKSWTINISTGKGFIAQEWKGAWGSDGPVFVGDLTGNGKDDVFMYRVADGAWTVNISDGKSFSDYIWQGNRGKGQFFVRPFDKHDKKVDMLIWNPGDTSWSVNLSTGTNWLAQSWAQQGTPSPSITEFTQDPKPLQKGQNPIIDYAVTVPPGCDLQQTIFLSDKNGYALESPTYTSTANGPLPLGGSYTFPAYFMMNAACQPNSNACSLGRLQTAGPIEVTGPPVLKILNFSATGGGLSSQSGALDVPVGTPVTLLWSVGGCGAHCSIQFEGVGTPGEEPYQISVSPELSPSGNKIVTIPVTDLTSVWTLTASDTDPGDAKQLTKLTIGLTPLPPTNSCASGCSYWYFQVSSPPDAQTQECFTIAEYAKDSNTARSLVQNQADAANDNGYTISGPISLDQFINSTCPAFGSSGN